MTALIKTLLRYQLSLLLCCVLSPVQAANTGSKRTHTLPGPITARVERVIDGDTLKVTATIWLDQELTILVRLSGIDAPEMRSRNPHNRARAWQAYKALYRMTYQRRITLRNIRRGKYAGRVIADLYLPDGTNVAKHMLKINLAVPYGRKFIARQICHSENCPRSKIDNPKKHINY